MVEETFADIAAKQNEKHESESLQMSVGKPTLSQSQVHAAEHVCLRFHLATSFWAVSVRAADQTVEFFLVPTIQLPLLREAETASRLKLKLTVESTAGIDVYYSDGVPIELPEVKTLLSSLCKDVLTRSKSDFDFIPDTMRVQFEDQSLTAAVRELLREKAALTDRIARQQEKLQSFIAAEIHDTVICNLLFMLRKIENDTPPGKDESTELLEGVIGRLRDLCTDLVPRDLGDWGLKVLVEDLFNKVCARSGLQGMFVCNQDLQPLPRDIELQIFRITQECLNNIEKHARAKKVRLQIDLCDDQLSLVLTDDGVGYDQSSGARKGHGFSIMSERVDMIRLQTPANLQVDSFSGSGTTITLTVLIAGLSPIGDCQ